MAGHSPGLKAAWVPWLAIAALVTAVLIAAAALVISHPTHKSIAGAQLPVVTPKPSRSLASTQSMAAWASSLPVLTIPRRPVRIAAPHTLPPIGMDPREHSMPAASTDGPSDDSARPAPQSTAIAGGATPIDLLLEVHLNQQAWHETGLFLGFGAKPDENLYAKGTDLQRWRLRLPPVQPYRYQGENYFSLNGIPGLTYRVDAATETLYIKAPADSFTGTMVDGLFQPNPQPQPTPLGGFVNYDFLGSRGLGASNINGLLEAGVFNAWGVGTSNFVGDNINHAHSRWTRLDTTWTHDNPATMTTLQLGDSITNPGMTGLAMRIGGIQYGTDFATRPYFVTFPLPTIGGQAALPSTVQLYVNGVLKESHAVPPGPFSVPAVPVVTGPGTATLVVHDLLGREQVISESFYTSPNLLKAGLNDYAFAAGKLRENFGLDSNDYGPFAATGLWRHGFSDTFTGELRAEASADLQDASFGGSTATEAAGVFSAALAASHSALGAGALGLVAYQWQGARFNAGLNAQLASPRYTELGYGGLPAPRRQISASVGSFLGAAGSVTLAYLDQESPLFGHSRLVTASYSVNAGPAGFFSINAFHALTGGNNGFTLTLTLPFGQRSNASFGVQRQNNLTQGYAQIQQSLPAGTGSGYRASAQLGPNAYHQAEYDYQNDTGTYRIGAQAAGGQTTYQAEASGALAFIGGGVFAARQINSAFGLVQVPGIANVTVYADNQPVGVTNGNGDALIPNLRPYQNNPVSLDPGSIPLSAQVHSLQLDAVPRFNSGVLVKFPITSTRGATLTIRLADGKPLPAGATVQVIGQAQTFPVGLAGAVYVTDLAAQNILRAQWNGEACEIHVSFPNSHDPLPDLGSFTCAGIKP